MVRKKIKFHFYPLNLVFSFIFSSHDKLNMCLKRGGRKWERKRVFGKEIYLYKECFCPNYLKLVVFKRDA